MDETTELLLEFAITTNVTRFAAGSYVGGEATNGATSSFSILISIQPLTDAEMLSLPEGRRARRWVRGYTNTALRIADQVTKVQADRVAFDGAVFEVERVEKWPWDLNHWKVYMSQLNPGTP